MPSALLLSLQSSCSHLAQVGHVHCTQLRISSVGPLHFHEGSQVRHQALMKLVDIITICENIISIFIPSLKQQDLIRCVVVRNRNRTRYISNSNFPSPPPGFPILSVQIQLSCISTAQFHYLSTTVSIWWLAANESYPANK